MGRSGGEFRFEGVVRSAAKGHGGDGGKVSRLDVWPVSHCGRCFENGLWGDCVKLGWKLKI
jgi:hypothetical protein